MGGGIALTLWVIVLVAAFGGFFVGIGAALGKLYMWLKGE